MEEEREKKKDIVVLDEGINVDGPGGPGPEYVCCWFVFSPFR
jgi:hypothetical protein